jgi:hypothetical protein
VVNDNTIPHTCYTASLHHVALLGLDYIWETEIAASNCVTVYKVNFLLENSSNARNSLSELREIQNFLGVCRQTPREARTLGG